MYHELRIEFQTEMEACMSASPQFRHFPGFKFLELGLLITRVDIFVRKTAFGVGTQLVAKGRYCDRASFL